MTRCSKPIATMGLIPFCTRALNHEGGCGADPPHTVWTGSLSDSAIREYTAAGLELYVARHEGTQAELEAAALRYAALKLEATGESGTTNAALILRQLAEDS